MYHQLIPDNASLPLESGDPYMVSASAFREQMAYLSDRGYSTVSLWDFAAYVSGKATLPLMPVIITFDDGRESDHVVAYPVLRSYGFVATFFVVTKTMGSPGFLSSEQLKDMKDNGMSIQSQTQSHSSLTELSQRQVKTELSQSRAILESKTGEPVRFLAIPGGMYNNMVKRIAQESGYVGAVTSDLGVNGLNSDMFALKRIALRRGITLSRFALYLEGRGLCWEKLRQLSTGTAKKMLGVGAYTLVRSKVLIRFCLKKGRPGGKPS